MAKFLDNTGLSHFWEKIKSYVSSQVGTKLDKPSGQAGQLLGFTAENTVGAVDKPVMRVTISGEDPENLVADKTSSEIAAAHAAGYLVFANVPEDGGFQLALGYITDYTAFFSGISNGMIIFIAVYSDNTALMQYSSFPFGQGTPGQYLIAAENGFTLTDGPEGLPDGGETGQVLEKTETGVQWTGDVVKLKTNILKLPGKGNWRFSYANDKIIAIPDDWVFSSDFTNIICSEDGISWSIGNLDLSGKHWNAGACYGNGKFVSSNGYSVIYSEDGVTWTLLDGVLEEIDGSDTYMAYGNGKFVVFSGETKYAYSEDGIQWTLVDYPSGFGRVTDMIFEDGRFVVITTEDSVSSRPGFYSTDGLSWTEFDLPDSKTYTRICYGNDRFVILAGASCIVYDKDFTSYKEITFPGSRAQWSDLCYGNGIFIARFSNRLAYSKDAVNWSEISSDESNISSRLGRIIYGNGTFFAIESGSGSNPDTLLISEDGLHWRDYKQSVINSDSQDIAEEVAEVLKVPNAPKTTTITLPALEWQSKLDLETSKNWYEQTVSVPGIIADSSKQIVHISLPTRADEEAWAKSTIRCDAQGNGTLTFTSKEIISNDPPMPTVDIHVDVTYQNL